MVMILMMMIIIDRHGDLDCYDDWVGESSGSWWTEGGVAPPVAHTSTHHSCCG